MAPGEETVASPADSPAAEAPAAPSLLVVDRWLFEDRHTIGYGSSDEDLELVHCSDKELGQRPEWKQADELFAFDDVAPQLNLRRRRATVVSRLLAIHSAFPEAAGEVALVFSVGFGDCGAGMVRDGRLVERERFPQLSLSSLWKSYRCMNTQLDAFLVDNPGKDGVVFGDFRAALDGQFRSDAEIPFVAAPDLSAVGKDLVEAMDRLDKYGEATCLVLSDWAATDGIARLAEAVRSSRTGRLSQVLRSADGMRDAFRGVFLLRPVLEPVRASVKAVMRRVRGREAGIEASRLQRIQARATEAVVRHNDPGGCVQLVEEIERSGAKVPPACDELLAHFGLERILPEEGRVLNAEELATVQTRPELPSNIKSIVDEGGSVSVARTLEAGFRATADGRVVKKPLVEIQVVEPVHWALVRDTRARLGSAAAQFEELLDGVMKLEHLPLPRYWDLLDVLRRRHEATYRRWLDLLKLEEFTPKEVAVGAPVCPGVEVENASKVPRRGIIIEKVSRVGFKNKVTGVYERNAAVCVTSNLVTLLTRTRALRVQDESVWNAVDELEKGVFPHYQAHEWFVRFLRVLSRYDQELERAWLVEFGLEEFQPGRVPDGRAQQPGLRTINAKTVWAEPGPSQGT